MCSLVNLLFFYTFSQLSLTIQTPEERPARFISQKTLHLDSGLLLKLPPPVPSHRCFWMVNFSHFLVESKDRTHMLSEKKVRVYHISKSIAVYILWKKYYACWLLGLIHPSNPPPPPLQISSANAPNRWTDTHTFWRVGVKTAGWTVLEMLGGQMISLSVLDYSHRPKIILDDRNDKTVFALNAAKTLCVRLGAKSTFPVSERIAEPVFTSLFSCK